MIRKSFKIFFVFLILSGVVFSLQVDNKFTAAKKILGKIDFSKLNIKNKTQNIQSAQFQKLIDIIKSIKPQSSNISLKRLGSVPLKNNITVSQMVDFLKINNNSDGKAKIWWNEMNGTPIFIDTKSAKQKNFFKANIKLESKKYIAKCFLNEYKNLMKIENPDNELVLTNADEESNGMTHLRYFQFYRGIKVWGKDLYVHLRNDGIIESINGRYEPTPVEIKDIESKISPSNALIIVKSDYQNNQKIIDENTPEKIIYFDKNSVPHLAFFIVIRNNKSEEFIYFVDAKTSKILHKYNNTKYDGPVLGKGKDLLNQTRDLNIFQSGKNFFMFDLSKPMYNYQLSRIPIDIVGGIVVLDAKNQNFIPGSQLEFVASSDSLNWSSNFVSLAYSGSVLYDYFKTVHNRNSIDDNGMTTYFVANVGNNFDHAFWNGYACYFGNGDGDTTSDYAGGLDIVGHEYGHGVVQYTANLLYEFQSGALNETFADWTGAMVEFYQEGDKGNWLIGEDISKVQGKCLRDLEEPSSSRPFIPQASRMSEYSNMDITLDNGGVHYNSGITNRAFCFLAKTLDENPSIGIKKMEKIMYRVLTKYLTQSAQFIDFRLAVIQAVNYFYPDSLYPDTEARIRGIFEYLGITDGKPTEPPIIRPPISGNDFIMYLGNNDTVIYKAPSKIPLNSSEIKHVEGAVRVWNKPSITEDGSIVCFVGKDNNIYLVDMAKGNLNKITSDQKWHSVSISPNGSFVAAIPNPEIETQKIYIIDIIKNSIEERQIYTPTNDNNIQNFALFVDVVDWSIDGEYLVFDCYNVQNLQGGIIKSFWDINLMQRSNGIITRIFPPLGDGIHVGNPSFSSTKDNVIAFDIFNATDPLNPVVYVSTYDLFSGNIGLINVNSNWVGYPGFSPNDKKIVFQTKNSNEFSTNLSQMEISSDGLNGIQSTMQLYIQLAMVPVWYATGPRVGVDFTKDAISSYELYPSYPNPFNSSAVIKYYLPQKENIKIEIYNILGEKVYTLFDGVQIEGNHSEIWNAQNCSSGLYLCRLITPNFQKSIKIIHSK